MRVRIFRQVEVKQMSEKYTKGLVGLAGGKRSKYYDGKLAPMVVTPPKDEQLRLLKAGEAFTSIRIALCEPSYYTPEPVALANAERIAACWNAFDGIPTKAIALIDASKLRAKLMDDPEIAAIITKHR